MSDPFHIVVEFNVKYSLFELNNWLFSNSNGTLYFPLQGFGRANHAVATEKLKARYPDYDVTWDNEGY